MMEIGDKSENLKLWDLVKYVDESYTKQYKEQTTISSLYPVQQMTAALGPVGQRWRPVIVEERFDEIKPVTIKGEFVLGGDGHPIFELVHTLRLKIQLRSPKESDTTWEDAAEQFGHTKYRYVAKANSASPYIVVDEEYAKKSYSDALKKCLSLFGVCANVYLGEFDTHEGRAENNAVVQMQNSQQDNAKQQEVIDRIASEVQDFKSCTETEAIEISSLRKIKAQKVKALNIYTVDERYKKIALAAIDRVNEYLNIKIKEKNGEAA